MHSKQNQVDYWPGFVDAIMNVLLNVLFMLCILAFGLALAKQAVKSSGDDRSDATQAAALVAKASPPATLPPLPPLLKLPIDGDDAKLTFSQITLNTVAAKESAGTDLHEGLKAKISALNVLTLEFTSNSEELSEEIKAQLKNSLPAIAKSQDHIRVWAVDKEQVENSNKLLFRRLMAVRNALLDYGIPAKQIDIRMLPGEGEKNTLLVYLASAPAPTPSKIITE
jgi:hypothetical protein